MRRTFIFCLTLLLIGNARAEVPVKKQSLSQLEQRRDAIVTELKQLAGYSLRSGVGAIGFRSQPYSTPSHVETIQIDFEQETPFDQIVLVPTLSRHAKTGFHADGFPLEFKLIAGTHPDTNGTVVAAFGAQDKLLPRIAPLVIESPQTTASWVRLETTLLSKRSFDGKFSLDLAEIMIFNGSENIALRMPVRSSSKMSFGPRSPDFLVDGFVPYLMDAAQGEQSIAVISNVDRLPPPAITIDLGQASPLNKILLHSVDQSDTVPQAFTGELGIPRHLRIDGANQPDFSDATLLLEDRFETIYDAGPVIIRRLPGTAHRYLRLTALDPYTYTESNYTRSRLGFAEIELLSKGRNVALGKPVSANFTLLNPDRSFYALTDGRNLYGNILPIRTWMNQLARRHELEQELPLVTAELNRHYIRQQANVRRLVWLVALLAAGIGFTILIEKMLRMRQAVRIKERFAADLHDELGANLHAIGILGNHAEDVIHSPEKLKRTVREIKSLTERAGEATRYCSNIQTSKEVHENLPEDMERTARRIIANLEYSFVVEGAEIINNLKPRTRSDLFLFYKESLININRHSDATDVFIELIASSQQIKLCISDNGCGIPANTENAIPSSLLRRAKLIGAKVSMGPSDDGGTCINLQLRPRRWCGQKRWEMKDEV